MTIRKKVPQQDAEAFLEKISGGPLTLAEAIASIRKGEGWSQFELGKKLGISRSHVCDIEKGRRLISPKRAASIARILGYSETQFVRLALQSMIAQSGLKMIVNIEAA